MSVIHVKTDEEFQELVEKFETCLVDFSASWCGPCRMIAPYYEQLAKQYPKMKFLKVDVDELERVAQSSNIRAMPTFIVFKHGAITNEIVRGANKDAILELVQRNLPPEPITPPVTPPTPPPALPKADEKHVDDDAKANDADDDKSSTSAKPKPAQSGDDDDVKSDTKCNCCLL